MNAARKPDVLIVDDDPIIRDVLRVILLHCGYRVVGDTGDGGQVLTLCGALNPEVVLLDINMPGSDGLRVLDALRERYPRVAVVMVTGETSIAKVQEALGKGACGYVVKPFNDSRLINAIEAALVRMQGVAG